ncbi:hypothetical protein Ancab_037651 [Ancistrocladus abbreviatus]
MVDYDVVILNLLSLKYLQKMALTDSDTVIFILGLMASLMKKKCEGSGDHRVGQTCRLTIFSIVDLLTDSKGYSCKLCLQQGENKDRGVKIEHEKKLATLQSQEYKGEDETKLDKTKASIKRLQSLIIVTSQAVNTISSAIIGLGNSDLVPQLVELCHGGASS